MNPNLYFEMPLDELAARVIAAGRVLAEDMPATRIAKDANQHGQIRRILGDLAKDRTLSDRVEEGVKVLVSILSAELDNETLGHEQVFDGHNDPEIGAVGVVYTHRILSRRGERIGGELQRLADYQRMRTTLRARLDADWIADRPMGR